MLSLTAGSKRAHHIATMWQTRFVFNFGGLNRGVRESRKQV